MGKKNLFGVRDGRTHVRRRPNWLHGVFWPARKIDKNVRINAGLAAQGQPVAILLSYISPSLVLKTFHRRALANIWLAFASLALFSSYFSSSLVFLLLLSFSFSRSFSSSITIIVPFALVCCTSLKHVSLLQSFFPSLRSLFHFLTSSSISSLSAISSLLQIPRLSHIFKHTHLSSVRAGRCCANRARLNLLMWKWIFHFSHFMYIWSVLVVCYFRISLITD